MPIMHSSTASRSLRAIPLIAVVLFAGCASRENVPGSIPSSGSLDEIINNAEGTGGQQVGQTGVTPLTGWAKPTVQVVRGPETAPVWVFPEPIETDQYGTVITKRDGYWIYTIAKSSSFVDLDAQNGSLDLKTLSNVEIGENGQVLIRHDESARLDAGQLQDMRSMAAGMRTPWTDGGKETARTTTVVIDDGRGAPRGTTIPAPATGSMVNADGSINQASLQQAMRAAEDRIKQAQANQTIPVPPQQGK